jgi:hypothetical protein
MKKKDLEDSDAIGICCIWIAVVPCTGLFALGYGLVTTDAMTAVGLALMVGLAAGPFIGFVIASLLRYILTRYVE